MQLIRNFLLAVSVPLLALAPSIAMGESAPTANAISQAQHQITSYLDKLADLHCTETVTQQKLSANGHVEATERAKYDYLIMMSGNGEDFQLNESRVEAPAPGRAKPTQLPMLVTNGVATILLVFHPYYRNSFLFEADNEEIVNGHSAIPVHFTHIAGRRTPAALALRGREYPLELQGTAWLDSHSGEVLKVEASLLHDMSDVGLRSLQIHVEYKPGDPSKDVGHSPCPPWRLSTSQLRASTGATRTSSITIGDSQPKLSRTRMSKFAPDPVKPDSPSSGGSNSAEPKEKHLICRCCKQPLRALP